MSFNLKDANAAKTSTVQYQRPGIYDNITVTKVNLGAASTGSKYLQFETLGADGSVGKSPQMYLNNVVTNPDKPTAWSITARNLKNYIKNTHNVSEEEADKLIDGVETEEQLAKKVSALLVGRPFRAKFSGVETSKGAIIAELSGSESMKTPIGESRLKYDSTRDTKKYQGTSQATTVAAVSSQTTDSDLPF